MRRDYHSKVLLLFLPIRALCINHDASEFFEIYDMELNNFKSGNEIKSKLAVQYYIIAYHSLNLIRTFHIG